MSDHDRSLLNQTDPLLTVSSWTIKYDELLDNAKTNAIQAFRKPKRTSSSIYSSISVEEAVALAQSEIQ